MSPETVSDRFYISQGLPTRVWDMWADAPGFDLSRAKSGWVVGVDCDDGNLWCVGVLFARRIDAEIARQFLVKRGITPSQFTKLSDDEDEQLERDIISALQW